eukprot:g16811.t1
MEIHGKTHAVQPIERRPYVPGISDLADSLNFDVMTDEDFQKMSEGFFAFEEDDSPSWESDSTYSESSNSGGDGDGGGCSLLSLLGRRELTAADDEKKDNGVIQSSFHELFGGSDGACAVADHFAALPVGKSSPSFTSHQPGGDIDNAEPCTVLALAAVGAGGAFVAGSSGRFGEDVVTFGGGLTAGRAGGGQQRRRGRRAGQNGVKIVADIAGVLPNGEVGAIAGGDGRGEGGGAQARQEKHVVGDAVEETFGGDKGFLTSVGNDIADTAAISSTSWLDWLRKAKRAAVIATILGGSKTTPDGSAEGAPSTPNGEQRLGAGWRPYPGAALYRSDVGITVAEEFGMLAAMVRIEIQDCGWEFEPQRMTDDCTLTGRVFGALPNGILDEGLPKPKVPPTAIGATSGTSPTPLTGLSWLETEPIGGGASNVANGPAVQPIERRPYVPGVSDLADSLNYEVMTDEDFHRMSEGFFAFEEDDSPYSESDSTYSNSSSSSSSSSGSGSGGGGSLLSMLGGRELTAADIGDDAACRRPMYAAPFDPSLRATTPHNAGFYDDRDREGEATAAGTGGGNGYTGTVGGSGGGGSGDVGGGAYSYQGQENGGLGKQKSREKKDNGVIQSSFHELFGVSDGACAVADHFAALPVGKSSPSFTSHQSGDDVNNAAACAVLALAAVGAGGAFVAGSSGRFGEEVVTFGGGLSAGGETMASGQDQEVPEAAITPDTLPDDAVDVTPNSQAEPSAEVRAVPDSTVDPEMVYDNGTAAATMGPEAWVMPESPPSADPVLEGNEVPSVAVDGLVRQSSATTAAVVPNNTPEAGAGPIPAAREDTDDMIVNDAAVEMRSNQAELVVASNVGAAAAPDIGVGMMAGIADLLPNGEIEAATGDGGEQGGGAQAREKQNVVGDAVEGTFGGDKGPLTSADKATADTADTAATTPTSWLGWLSMAKHAIVTAALPRVNSTTDGKRNCLGAGWRPYPGGVLYRRDVGIPAVEGTFGVRGHKNRALWYS